MDDSSSIWILFAILWVAFGVGSAAIAKTKNRNPAGYFFLGFFLGLIGLLITVAMPQVGAKPAGYGVQPYHGAHPPGPTPRGVGPPSPPGFTGQRQGPGRCHQCGSTVGGSMQFCSYCGALLSIERGAPRESPAGGTPGMTRTVSRDILVSGRPAFRKGEQVLVEKVEPHAQRPEYRYVVHSSLLDRRFLLSDADIAP